MIITSSVLMYMLMYLHTYKFGHVFFSETRLYMNLIMTTVMALVMLWFMRHMYTDKKTNHMIVGGSIALFALSLFEGVKDEIERRLVFANKQRPINLE